MPCTVIGASKSVALERKQVMSSYVSVHPAEILVGTTMDGGVYLDVTCNFGCGTVFEYDVSTGEYTDIHLFNPTAYENDGYEPYASPSLIGQSIYGTTAGAGCNPACPGSVWTYSTAGGYSTLYNFSGGNDGGTPVSGVISPNGGTTLYGTTSQFGANGCGTVWTISSGVESTYYTFTGATTGDGCYPTSLDVNGTDLVGMTLHGGTGTACGAAAHCGTFFLIQ
jgi:hypothetical protein